MTANVNIAPLGTVKDTSQFTVYYEDTDFSGFVYHATYLKFFERAREHLLGIDYIRSLYKDGFHFVVHGMNLQFTAPAQHGDIITVETTCTFSRSPAVHFRQVATKAGSTSLTLVSADISAVLLGAGNKPVRLPMDVVAHLLAKTS